MATLKEGKKRVEFFLSKKNPSVSDGVSGHDHPNGAPGRE
jgi:hypothetical protein